MRRAWLSDVDGAASASWGHDGPCRRPPGAGRVSEPVPVYVEAGVPVAVTFPERIEAIPDGGRPGGAVPGNRR